MAFHGGHIAAAAAAEKRRRMMQEEEESMTKYSPADLNEDWEFKIVRAETPVFRKTEVFQQLLQEEAIAGWQLVEKLDDMRVRFKRSPAARKRDAMLPQGVDPYRTRFGGSARSLMLIAVMVLLLSSVAVGIIPVILDKGAPSGLILSGAIVLILILALAALVFIRLRR